jgi:dipeptidase D
MENILSNLEPKAVWKYFEEITQVPRPSKQEEKIIEFLIAFGEKNNLETKRDEIGNVLICKPATKGKEKLKTVILQSHMDMVCEKNSDVTHDFLTDPIKPLIKDGWVTADGTTLGADDGIGVAAQMAILTATDIEHGPIECLFTVDEETGLTGAFALQPGFMKGKILLNLDSEDEGELFIGCAGGIDTLAKFKYKKEKPLKKSIGYKISVTGLKGGHSGDEIHKGLGNSNKIINRILWEGMNKFNLELNEFDGGNLRNAIPREAFSIVVIPESKVETFLSFFENFVIHVKAELKTTEPDLSITIEEIDKPKFVIDKKSQRRLLNGIYACPHGVIEMSRDIPDLVETSTNLASVKFTEKERILVTTSQRSSVDSSKHDIANMMESVFKLAKAKVWHTDGYPGWAPNTDSEILKITEKSYKKLFKVDPVVRAIHAGLECGLFLEKYPDMDMISFGPTLRNVHSPDERIEIGTVQKFWDLLIDVLRTIPEEK